MTIAELYREIVLDHHRAPRRRGALPDPTHAAEGDNPLCGDRVRFELRVREDVIEDLRHSGEACVVTTATASILSEWAAGRSAEQLAALRRRFEAFLAAAPEAEGGIEPAALGALVELRRYPARHRCALLPFETLAAALRRQAHASTESEPPHEDRQHA
jgi:nitrogen fixation NifU-like protein